ncbi:MAG: hypothetical protein ABSG51_03705 [Terracidiphilus sp.]
MSLSPRINRRLLVTSWWLSVALFFGVAAYLLKDQRSWPNSVLTGYINLFALLAINSLGMFVWAPRPDPKKFSAGIRTLFDAALRAEMKRNPPADEREERQRDKATRRAYEVLILAFLVFLFLHFYGLMPRARVFRDLLAWFVFFAILNLPNAVYLWNEPDMEEPQ